MYNYIIKNNSLLQYLSRPMLFIARCSFIPGYLLKKIKKIWLLWPGAPVANSEAGNWQAILQNGWRDHWMLINRVEVLSHDLLSGDSGGWRHLLGTADKWSGCVHQDGRLWQEKLCSNQHPFVNAKEMDTIIRPSLIHQLLFGTWTILNKSLDGHLPTK